MKLYLVRHGEAAASWGQDPDPGLSDTGLEQARRVARALLPALPGDSALLSSPLARARQTSEPLADELQSVVSIDPVFREIPAPVPLSERQGWLQRFMTQHWHEQSAELLNWRSAVLERLVQMQGPTVIFTHFLVINAVVGSVTGRAETLCCWPANGSITELTLESGQLSLTSLGEQMQTHVN